MSKPMTSVARWRTAWEVLIPHIPVPSEAEAAVWQRFPQVEVDRAINRCRWRYALNMIHDGFKPSDAYNWVTFVANEAAKTERKRVWKKLQFCAGTTTVTDADALDDNIGNRA